MQNRGCIAVCIAASDPQSSALGHLQNQILNLSGAKDYNQVGVGGVLQLSVNSATKPTLTEFDNPQYNSKKH